MRVLLDTCVLSELRHPKGHPGVHQAVDALNEEELFVSVITIGEIVKGISRLRESPKKRALEAWINALEHDYGDRLLSIDLEPADAGEKSPLTQKRMAEWSLPPTDLSPPRRHATVFAS